MPIETPLDILLIETCKKIHERKWFEVCRDEKEDAVGAVICQVRECIFARWWYNLLCAHPNLFKNGGYHTIVMWCLYELSSEKQRKEIEKDYMQLIYIIGRVDQLQRLSCGGYVAKESYYPEALWSLSVYDPLMVVLNMMEEYVDNMLVGGLTNDERTWPSEMYPVSDKKRAEFDTLIETAEWIIGYRMSEVIKRLRFQYLVTLASV